MEFTGEIHPLASDYPMISADELADLADSITQQGQLDPITLSPEGMLLDGRNRLAACDIAGVEPRFEVYDGDPVAFIVGKNANRRQLSAGQRAMAIAIGLWESPVLNAETGKWESRWDHAAGRWKYGAKSIVPNGTVARSADLSNCGTILNHNRDLAREVLAGSSLRATYDKVCKEREAATERAKQMDTLRDKASDLLTQVTDETLTLDEAWGAYRIRYEKEIAAEQADLERRRDQATALARCLSTLGTITVPESRDRISAPPSRLLYTYDTARVRRAGITGL